MTVNEFAEFFLYDLATLAGVFVVILAWIIVGISIIVISIKKRKKK